MPIPGKESERRVAEIDQLAVREVENYLEKVEKQAENPTVKQAVQVQQTDDSLMPQTPQVPLTPVVAQKPIVLPMVKAEVEDGMKQKTTSGVRWLAEWCVMMIKKYPGRVFFMTQKA